MGETSPHRRANLNIRPAVTPAEMEQVRTLFRDYQAFLNVDLCFQDFEAELATLPGAYAPPKGGLLLAWDDSDPYAPQVAGGVAVRPLKGGSFPGTCCEMKRLFVRDAWKGCGLGRRLALEILQIARTLGYDAMVLDTLARLESAVVLYQSLGFAPIDPYYDNPLPEVIFMGKNL